MQEMRSVAIIPQPYWQVTEERVPGRAVLTLDKQQGQEQRPSRAWPVGCDPSLVYAATALVLAWSALSVFPRLGRPWCRVFAPHAQ
jgi:hypothetical protein